MFQISCLKVEYGKYQIVSVLIQHKPWRTEGILKIPHYMDFTRRGVSFCQKICFLAIFIDCHINYHYCMTVLLSITGRINKHIARLHISQPSRCHLPAQ